MRTITWLRKLHSLKSLAVLIAFSFGIFAMPGSAENGKAASEIKLISSILSFDPSNSSAATPTFYINEHINYSSKVTYSDRSINGPHRVTYKWYTGDKVVFNFDGNPQFSSSPAGWSAWISGTHLGEGHHKVEMYIDGNLLDRREFDVLPGGRPADSKPTTNSTTAGNPLPNFTDPLSAEAFSLLNAGDFDGFDGLASRLRKSKERNSSGEWRLTSVYNCVKPLSDTVPTSPIWIQLENTSTEWRNKHPESATAVVIAANVLIQHAWAYRGSGYGSEIPEENKRHYRRMMEQAWELIEKSQSFASIDPAWDTARIVIAKHLNAPKDQIFNFAREALGREAYYYPTHYAASIALLPKWGGSEDLVKDYVQLALDKTKEKEGTQVYGRIYAHIAANAPDPQDELNMSGAKWPAMKQSFDEIIKSYPDTFNLDSYRAIACIAGAADAYRNLGPRADVNSPGLGAWDIAEFRRGCDDWAFKGKQPEFDPEQRAHAYLSFFRGFGEGFWRTVRWTIFIVIVLMELAFWTLEKLSRQKTRGTRAGQSTAQHFNPREYPRTYRFKYDNSWLSNRTAIRLMIMGATLGILLCTAPWGNPTEALIAVGICGAISFIGLIAIAQRLKCRVVLKVDALDMHMLLSRQSVLRNDIAGRRTQDRGNIFLIGKGGEGYFIAASNISGVDEEFWGWFDAIPLLTASVIDPL